MADATPSTRTSKFLKPSEVTACKKLAASDKADKQRATALLAIHQGETQLEAAKISGLTIGQVKYIVTRFRRLRMAALSTDEQPKTVSADVAVKPAEPKKDDTVKKKKKDAKKAKKDKDDKKKDKDKKNKDKKSKKDKKKKSKKKK